MQTRSLGTNGPVVSRIGYGAMALSLANRPGEAEAVRMLEGVLASGVNLIDTADTYCLDSGELHHNERLIAATCSRWPGRVVVATKGGTRRTARGWEVDGDPEFLYQSICASHRALGGNRPIPVWQLHWPDPRYAIEAMLRPARRAMDEGLVEFVGVCNVSVQQLERACSIVPVVSVQNQFNFWHREPEVEGVIEYCERNGLAFLPWRPLGGLGLSQRLEEIGPLCDLARERAVSPQRLVIAWQLAKSPCIIPIPGTRQAAHFHDCLAAADLTLTAAEFRVLDAVSPAKLPRRERPSAWEGMPPLASGAAGAG